MSFCAICYNDIKQHNIFKGGCCNIDLCLDCVKKCDKCPQCKIKYFWVDFDNNEIKELQQKNALLEMNNFHLDMKVNILKNKMMELASDMINKNSIINKLKQDVFNLVEFIYERAEQEENINDLEEVIKKYNLNVI